MRMKMNVKFKELVEQMPGLLQSLGSQPFRTRDNLASISERGIYVFYENDRPLYIGRSNRLRGRIQEHARESSGHNKATFAFNLAKEALELTSNIPRKELERDPGFKMAFDEAKKCVREMKIRVIQIEDQVTQALFEIYAALALDTAYNDFGTH
ncbi:MAG: GIY-YIG nuclease family protein [Dehalococcoidia bacterium]|nr:GIY-YIG nuclease family protein [Dehalococcoidia bacterium]